MSLTQWLAIWFIAAVVASPFIGNLLHNRRVNRQFRGHLESERRRVRLEKLVELSDEYDNAPTDKERQRVFIKASALGFTDDSHPFALDPENHEHPTLPRAS